MYAAALRAGRRTLAARSGTDTSSEARYATGLSLSTDVLLAPALPSSHQSASSCIDRMLIFSYFVWIRSTSSEGFPTE